MSLISRLACGSALGLWLCADALHAQTVPGDPPPQDQIVVTAQRLNTARESIKPSLGAVDYTLGEAAIRNLPGGDNQPIQDIILQLPGVSQDQFGQFHVRDEHNGVQYRLNGVIIPESIAVFGQILSPRLVQKLDLVTGTLPAQYGLRTAGIIDITTKSGLKDQTTVSLYGGSNETIQPSVQVSGSAGATTWFASADFKHSDLGIDNVTGARSAIHDRTNQFNLFGYIDHVIGDSDRVALTGGYANQHYQIPNPPALVGTQSNAQGLPVTVDGQTAYPSALLNERQLQVFGFGALSWLHAAGPFTSQVSVFARVANLDYRPDDVGELLFNGLAQQASKRDVALGLQADSALTIGSAHTLRFGGLIDIERSHSATQSLVFPTTGDVYDPDAPLAGFQLGLIDGPPLSLGSVTDATQHTYSLYVQDEWHLLPSLVLNYGARFDRNEGPRHEQQLSPRANLVWSGPGALTVHLGYARYFSPAPFELVASTNLAQVENTTIAANVRADDPAFAQRESYYDVGVQKKIGHLTLGIDGYYRHLRQAVDEGQFGAPIILTPFNYARGVIEGVEATAQYVHGPFSAYANLAVARARGTGIDSSQYNFSAADLAYIASHWIFVDHNQTLSGSAGAAYRWRSGVLKDSRISTDLVLASGLRSAAAAADGSTIPNGAALPAHATVNLTLGHQFTAAGLDVHVDVQNLFDRIYEIRDGTGVGVGAPSFGARRGVFVGISKTL